MYKNILVINLMYIGDLLFTTPLLRTLRIRFPNANIAMLVDEKNADVIRYNENLSEVIGIDKKGYHNKLPNYIRLIADIRKRKYDLVVNLHGNERSTVIAAFSGGKKIIGFSAKGCGAFFDATVNERRDIHQADAYLEVVKAININQFDNRGLEMWVDESAQHRADEMWENTVGKQIIGFNTGGSWPTKRWTKIGFAKLADKLIAEGYGVAFFGGPMDVSDVEEILSMMVHKTSGQVRLFTGKTSLLEMAALVKKCTAMVTGDSGPMHIAVSQKVKVVVIFGPSNPVRYAPYQQEDSVLQSSQGCLCCGQHHCDHHSCMKDISYEQVYDILMKQLTHS